MRDEMTGFYSGPPEVAVALARGLLQVGAVEIRPREPFTWSSGWLAPMYCDNRMILAYPVLRNLVADAFLAIVRREYPGVDVIAGTATAGIPHAAVLADRLGIAGAYVRSSAKDHGKQKQVEGRVRAGDRVVVVEDTVSTGQSVLRAVAALRGQGANVLAVLAIYSYDFPQAAAALTGAQVPLYRLVHYDALIAQARALGMVAEADMAALRVWRQDPAHYRIPET
ncbi:orotate phosphoribosyltransferase [Alicyclobacillus cellulosilyticus]|uniref:Orotate phosphoribosyltransferase n=2 Tax=Alicyclobacillus cellulosilyticus TaxID=1003997 RepID=A0A917K414_9BACL|nr:orotate phosphoribosyltransferase [Alicyclobacillus cellulosilyticus]